MRPERFGRADLRTCRSGASGRRPAAGTPRRSTAPGRPRSRAARRAAPRAGASARLPGTSGARRRPPSPAARRRAARPARGGRRRSRPTCALVESSAPRKSTASAISSALRAPAPSSSMSAVRLARPNFAAGSTPVPALMRQLEVHGRHLVDAHDPAPAARSRASASRPAAASAPAAARAPAASSDPAPAGRRRTTAATTPEPDRRSASRLVPSCLRTQTVGACTHLTGSTISSTRLFEGRNLCAIAWMSAGDSAR